MCLLFQQLVCAFSSRLHFVTKSIEELEGKISFSNNGILRTSECSAGMWQAVFCVEECLPQLERLALLQLPFDGGGKVAEMRKIRGKNPGITWTQLDLILYITDITVVCVCWADRSPHSQPYIRYVDTDCMSDSYNYPWPLYPCNHVRTAVVPQNSKVRVFVNLHEWTHPCTKWSKLPANEMLLGNTRKEKACKVSLLPAKRLMLK